MRVPQPCSCLWDLDKEPSPGCNGPWKPLGPYPHCPCSGVRRSRKRRLHLSHHVSTGQVCYFSQLPSEELHVLLFYAQTTDNRRIRGPTLVPPDCLLQKRQLAVAFSTSHVDTTRGLRGKGRCSSPEYSSHKILEDKNPAPRKAKRL